MNLLKIASLLAVTICVPVSVHAQEPAKEPGKASKQARFLFLSKLADTPGTIQVQGRSEPKDLMISTRSPGQYHVLPATGKITIGTVQTVEGEEVLVPLATGQIPEGSTKVLALVFPVSAKTYKMIVLDENKFKPGSICFINTTPNNIGALIGDKKYGIKAKSNSIVQPTVSEKSRNTYAAFYNMGTVAKAIHSKMITESTWNISPERAEICMFYLHPARKTIGMRVLSSYYGKNTDQQERTQ